MILRTHIAIRNKIKYYVSINGAFYVKFSMVCFFFCILYYAVRMECIKYMYEGYIEN